MSTTHTLKKGWGYWDVTHYPFGGCFRRAMADTPCEVTGPEHQHFIKAKLDGGCVVFLPKQGLVALSESEVAL